MHSFKNHQLASFGISNLRYCNFQKPDGKWLTKLNILDKFYQLWQNEKAFASIKEALEEIRTDRETDLADKIRLVEELQRKSSMLEEAVSRSRKETETLEVDLRGTIKSLENQLAQREEELQTSRNEAQQLKAASEQLLWHCDLP